MHKHRVLIILVLVAAIFVEGCKSKPERKKMPGMSFTNGFFNEQQSTQAEQPRFIVSDTLMGRSRYFSIAIPDPSSDSTALAMLQSCKLVAGLLYNALVKEGDKGVVIDLCSNEEQTYQTELTVDQKDGFSLPVKLLWNNKSRQRAFQFLNGLQGMTEFQYTLTKGELPVTARWYLTQNCFYAESQIK